MKEEKYLFFRQNEKFLGATETEKKRRVRQIRSGVYFSSIDLFPFYSNVETIISMTHFFFNVDPKEIFETVVVASTYPKSSSNKEQKGQDEGAKKSRSKKKKMSGAEKFKRQTKSQKEKKKKNRWFLP